MSIASTGTSTGHLAWWRASKPDYIFEPDGDAFYSYVRSLRSVPLETRSSRILEIVNRFRPEEAGDEQEVFDPPTELDLWFYGFWLAVESSVFLDKKRGGKFLMMFKDFSSFERPKKLMVLAGGRLGELLERINDRDDLALPGWLEDADAYESVRRVLFPPKPKILTEDQEEGFKEIKAFEAEKKIVEAAFAEYEEELLRELKIIRATREVVRTEMRSYAPQYDDLKKARQTKLNYSQKVEASKRYQASPDLQNDYTEEGYIALVQDNVARRAERGVYSIFRLKGGVEAVRRAKDRAKAKISQLKNGGTPAPQDEKRARAAPSQVGGLNDEDFEVTG
jgi:hypothetical protein